MIILRVTAFKVDRELCSNKIVIEPIVCRQCIELDAEYFYDDNLLEVLISLNKTDPLLELVYHLLEEDFEKNSKHLRKIKKALNLTDDEVRALHHFAIDNYEKAKVLLLAENNKRKGG